MSNLTTNTNGLSGAYISSVNPTTFDVGYSCSSNLHLNNATIKNPVFEIDDNINWECQPFKNNQDFIIKMKSAPNAFHRLMLKIFFGVEFKSLKKQNFFNRL